MHLQEADFLFYLAFFLNRWRSNYLLCAIPFVIQLGSSSSEETHCLGSSFSEETYSSDSEVNQCKEKPYELLTTGISTVGGLNGNLRCPFCDDKKKQDYDYNTHFRHAIGVAEGSTNISAKQKGSHLALAEYLETCLSNSALLQNVIPASVAKTTKNNLFYWPSVGIIAYILI